MKYLLTILTTIMAFVMLTIAMPDIAFAGSAKVEVCHFPLGNPDNYHTIKISDNALAAHLAHSDLVGACDAGCAVLCDDGNACTVDDTGDCLQNGCPSDRAPVDCNDSDSCTADSCDPASGCVNTNNPVDLTGDWSGPFNQSGWVYPIELNLDANTCDGAVGILGSAYYPTFYCGGNWYLESSDGNNFTVIETDMYGPCYDGCRYDLSYDPDTDILNLVGSSGANCAGDVLTWTAVISRQP